MLTREKALSSKASCLPLPIIYLPAGCDGSQSLWSGFVKDSERLFSRSRWGSSWSPGRAGSHRKWSQVLASRSVLLPGQCEVLWGIGQKGREATGWTWKAGFSCWQSLTLTAPRRHWQVQEWRWDGLTFRGGCGQQSRLPRTCDVARKGTQRVMQADFQSPSPPRNMSHLVGRFVPCRSWSFKLSM